MFSLPRYDFLNSPVTLKNSWYFFKWNDEMTYFQLAISTLALGNENCVTWETATSAKDFCLFLLPVCVVCKCVILSCLAITHVWNLGCACGVGRLAFASSVSGAGFFHGAACEVRGSGGLLASIHVGRIHSTVIPGCLHFFLGMRLTIYLHPASF